MIIVAAKKTLRPRRYKVLFFSLFPWSTRRKNNDPAKDKSSKGTKI
jgi:hypothetical protein